MLATTVILLTLGFTACSLNDTKNLASMRTMLHRDHWRLYLVFCALGLPPGAWLLKELT